MPLAPPPPLLYRPVRTVRRLALLVVVAGLLFNFALVARDAGDGVIHWSGTAAIADLKPDVQRNLARLHAMRYGYPDHAVVDERTPATSTGIATWGVVQLLPWLLAAIALALLWPLLRAAERDDPFAAAGPARLGWAGALLLVGLPAAELMRYAVAESASTWTTYGGVLAEPQLPLSPLILLPGATLLALAAVFHRGGELRELERHTI